MSPNNTAELQQQLAEALMERDEARRERDEKQERLDTEQRHRVQAGQWTVMAVRIQELRAGLAAAEAERETLRGYVQHKTECNTRSRPNFGGPYICTCGLASCLTPSTPKEP